MSIVPRLLTGLFLAGAATLLMAGAIVLLTIPWNLLLGQLYRVNVYEGTGADVAGFACVLVGAAVFYAWVTVVGRPYPHTHF